MEGYDGLEVNLFLTVFHSKPLASRPSPALTYTSKSLAA